MKPLTQGDVLTAWARGRELLLKGGEGGPGWPSPPPRDQPRAPRRPVPMNPTTGRKESAPVHKVEQITLGKLKDMLAAGTYDKPRQRSARAHEVDVHDATQQQAVRQVKVRKETPRPTPSMFGTKPNNPF